MRKSNQRDLTPVSYIIGTLFYKHHPRKYKLDRRAVKIFENRKITLRLFQSGTATAGGGQFWVFLGVKFRAGKFRKTRATPENRSSATLHTPRGRQRTEAAKLSARVRLFEFERYRTLWRETTPAGPLARDGLSDVEVFPSGLDYECE